MQIDEDKIAAALAGEIETTSLNEEEETIWTERFIEKMGEPGPEEEAFFEGLKWLEENVDAFAAQADWHESHGHPLAEIIAAKKR
ncbi:type II toxin-antitoxin system CcdA family antitoxin [Tritonibacter mobilis]|uniref:hypothetical protein n=1 Tax=Tritonibacter mobilis TaxID=379347 RepID=UPI001CD97135|nr:hypothetical protein [Tritonibacter mobilis]MCA2008642.1 hypothetical protein [Tritonibacter mobilis]